MLNMHRMKRLALGLTLLAWPLLEIAVLVKAGQLLGFWSTMAIVIGTGVLGVMVLLRQRMAVVSGVVKAVNEGRPPLAPVLDGAFLVLAGGLLFSPGLISDVLGLLLLIPAVRGRVARWSVARLAEGADIQVTTFGSGGPAAAQEDGSRPIPRQGTVIEGEFKRLDEHSPKSGDNHRRKE